jgi:hypothetical protein
MLATITAAMRQSAALCLSGCRGLTKNDVGAAHLIDVLSADGKSRGTGIVTAPVAAHSVPRWSRTM